MQTPDARRTLLARLIDHAPTFPPAALPPAEALLEDERASASPHAWLLARLVWPASRLGDVARVSRPVSAVLDTALPADAAVAAVETRYDGVLDALSDPVYETYVELPIDDALETRLDRLAELGLRAKVRCGGAAVPTVEELARFVRACRDRSLAFKATAGLHHAVRTNGEHGFLNLLAASTFEGDEEAVLAERDPAAFTLDETSFGWRARHAAPDHLGRVRAELLVSIGSCSFFEPVEELEGMGLLG